MHTQTLNDRQRAFILTAYLVEKDGALDLIPFLPQSEQGLIEAALLRLSQKKEAQKNQVIQDELRRLLAVSNKGLMAELHPDWIVQAIQNESGQMIATIIRYLPGDKVKLELSTYDLNKGRIIWRDK